MKATFQTTKSSIAIALKTCFATALLMISIGLASPSFAQTSVIGFSMLQEAVPSTTQFAIFIDPEWQAEHPAGNLSLSFFSEYQGIYAKWTNIDPALELENHLVGRIKCVDNGETIAEHYIEFDCGAGVLVIVLENF